MRYQKLKLPLLIIAIGIVAAIVLSLVLCVAKVPAVTEQEFRYSVTYRLNGDTKTLVGAYTCRFDDGGELSVTRLYVGEYKDQALGEQIRPNTVAKSDEYSLGIEIGFNDSYLMGDTKNEYYDDGVQEPYFVVYDSEGYANENTETVRSLFGDAEIVSWELPESIENSFAFAGFAPLHEDCVPFTVAVGLLALLACLILVKKEGGVAYAALDRVGVILSWVNVIVILPILYALALLIQLYQSGPDWIYAGYLCTPALVPFSLAASVSLRRKGFAKSGFGAQLVPLALFILLCILEYAI